MSDLKLFRIQDGTATELAGSHALLEKHLQRTVEANMETLLEVRFLASKYSTGKRHNGRIDTLGIDENGSPVIVEYKRTRNDNVINQGLFYLDWLMDHRAEFQQLVAESDHHELAASIDWSTPRLICVATDYSRYDRHAVQQIDGAIDLVTYRDFGGELLSLMLVHSNATDSTTTAARPGPVTVAVPEASAAADVSSDSEDAEPTGRAKDITVLERFAQSTPQVQDLFTTVADYCESLGSDVSKKTLKHWISFRRLKSFATINVYPSSGQVLLHLRLNPDTVELKDGFTRDVSNVNHHGVGDLEVRIITASQLEDVYALIQRAYENS